MRKKTSQVSPSSFGQYLASLRTAIGLTLREVEEKTEKEVSNGYLSQLEHGRILKPSPNILYKLAEVYNVPYERLMEMAGYIGNIADQKKGAKHGRVAAFAVDNLTTEEEEELLSYLAYLRSKKKKHAKS